MLFNIKRFIWNNIFIYLLIIICFLCNTSYVSAQFGWQPEFIKAASSLTTPDTGGIKGQVTNTEGVPLDGILLAAIDIFPKNASLTTFAGTSPVQSILGPVAATPWILFSEDKATFNKALSSLYNYYYGYGYYGESDEDSPTIKIYQTSTDSEGKFLFQGLYPGKYVVVAYDPTERGYIFSDFQNDTISYYSFIVEDDDLTIVNANNIAGPLTISLELGGNLIGKVVDKNTGEPIEGIPFEIINQYTDSYSSYISSPMFAISDSEGKFAFYGLPTGNYYVRLNYSYSGKYLNPSSIPSSGYYYSYPYGFQSDTENIYEISQGKTTTGCEFALEAGGVISGRILSQTDGRPIKDMSVVAISSNPEYISYSSYSYVPYGIEKTSINMEDGTYCIEGLASGSYIVTVNHLPSVTPYSDNIIRANFQPAYYGDTQNIDETEKISITQGEEIKNIDFHLKPGSVISGKAFDAETNAPLGKIRVVAYPQSYSYPFSLLATWYSSGYDVITDSNGRFEIVGLFAGDYTLNANDYNSMNYNIYGTQDTSEIYLNACYCTGTKNSRCDECEENNIITIGDAEIIEDINFYMVIGGCIKGRLVNTEGEGISGLMVNVWSIDNTSSRIFTGPSVSDNEGNFCICGLSSGFYEFNVDVGLGSQDYLEAKYDNPDIVDEAGLIKVVESETTECGDLILQRGGSITGLVTNTEAEPLEYIMVGVQRLSEEDSYYIPSIETGKDGRFTLRGMPSGIYQIIATDLRQNTYLEATYCESAGEMPDEDSCSIKVTAPNETSGITIVMHKGGIISGTVLDADTGLPYKGNMAIQAWEKSKYSKLYGPYENVNLEPSIYNLSTEYLPIGINAYVDKNGNYELRGFPEGSYIISIGGEQSYTYGVYGVGYPVGYSDYATYPYPYNYPNNQDSSANVNYLTQYYKDAANIENATPVIVAPDKEISNIDFHLLQGSSIKGTVRDSVTGEPITVPYVSITLLDLDGNMIKAVNTNISAQNSPYDPLYYAADPAFYSTGAVSENIEPSFYGTYTISAIPRSTYLLKASANNYFEAYYHVSNEASTEIDLTSKNDLENIDIFLEKKGSISGRVIREMDQEPITSILLMPERLDKTFDPFFTGKPLSSSDLLYGFCPPPSPYEAESESICINPYGGAIYSGDYLLPFGYSDEDGNYTIYGLEPGTYRIFARDQKFTYRDEYYDNASFDEPQLAIEVQLGRGENLKGIDFSLPVGNTYEGPDLKLPEMPNEEELKYISSLYDGYGSSAMLSYGYQTTGISIIDPSMPYSDFPVSTGYVPVDPYATNIAPMSNGYTPVAPLPSEPYINDTVPPVPTGYQPYPTDITPMLTEYQPPDSDIIGEPMPPSQAGEPDSYGDWSNNKIPQVPGVPTQAPKIISEPDKSALVGDIYTYQIVATNPSGNNDTLKYYLEISPDGMSIDNQTGLITWSPDKEDIGSTIIKFKVVAEDSGSFTMGYVSYVNMISSQSYQLDIIEDTTPPEDVTGFISFTPFWDNNALWNNILFNNNLNNSRLWKQILGNSPNKFPWEDLSNTSLIAPLSSPTISNYYTKYNTDNSFSFEKSIDSYLR